MKKLIAAIRRAPKRAAAFMVVASAVLVPAALFAWGPDRPTFTMEQPAPYVTFNSITNNPTHGDERNFVQIKDATAPNSSYGENVALAPGKDYEVYVYYHNNAASNLNDASHNYKGIAKDAAMRVEMPATVKAGEKARITGFVGASNAQPAQVWDEAYGSTASDVALRYVPGSATIHSNGAVNGQKLPDSLYTTGTPLGFNALDGKLPGCNEFAGYVTFKIHVDQPNFEVQKQVSKAGENKYAETITALPNEEVEYKIQYKNTGTVQQDNVVIRDKLPAGLTYVNGSTQVSNATTNSQWTPIADNSVVGDGINMGSYAPGGNLYVKFKAKITDNSQLEKCGVNTLINTAHADTENGSKSDTANVTVSKECEEPEEPKYVCDALTIEKIDRTHYKFETKYTAEHATFKHVTYQVHNETGVMSFEAPATHTFETNTEGNHTVKATVAFTVNGEEKTATSASCEKNFTVTPPNKVEVCNPETGEIIVVDEKDQDKYVPVGDEACKPIEVCNPETGEIITVKPSEADSYKPVGDKACQPAEECKPGIPMNDERCETQPPEECKPGVPMDDKACEETPVTPAELPKTGASDSIIALIGAGSLIASIGYYIASRRALN